MVYRDEAGRLRYNFDRIDAIYDQLLDMGIRPIVELSFMPAALARDPEQSVFTYRGIISPPAHWEEWREFVASLATHLVQRNGIDEVAQWAFEVWNEPNLEVFWSGTQEEYLRLYDESVRAARHVVVDGRMRRLRCTFRQRRCTDRLRLHTHQRRSARQAMYVRDAIARRLAECRLEMHAEKTRIVYCKDSDRTGSYEHERFDFLGYGFRPRLSKSRTGKRFVNFTPAVSDEAVKEIGQRIRNWHLHKRSDETLSDLALMANATVRGWINYYGRFCPSELHPPLRRINEYLIRWAERKHKRLLGRTQRAHDFLADVARREPSLFAHWRYGLRP